jgi:uncharacterized membrane protein
MKRGRLRLLVGTCLVSSVTVATANVAVPMAMRIALGALIVLILPGFAVSCACFPQRQLSLDERLLASVGLSLAISTCAALLLGAMPIGLSRGSLAAVLGASTIVLSIYAGSGARLGSGKRRSREST